MKKHLATVASVAIITASAIANVYISAGNSIFKFAPDGTQSTFAAGLSNPQGLAFGNDGNLYVVNAGNDTISRITPDGAVSTFVTLSLPLFVHPQALAIDLNGNLFVAAAGLKKITPGGVVSTFSSVGGGALAFDTAGYLYAVGGATGRISKISPTGIVSNFVPDYSQISTGIGGIAFGFSGNLFVTDLNQGLNEEVSSISPDGSIASFATLGNAGFPYAIAFDPAGLLYVSSYDQITGDHRLATITASGASTIFASGITNPKYITVQPTPEPGTALYLLIGFAAVFRRNRTLTGNPR